MFKSRFFSARYWAARFWGREGDDGPLPMGKLFAEVRIGPAIQADMAIYPIRGLPPQN